MARSKNRKNMQTQHQSACYTKDARCRCVQCVTDRNLAGKNSSTPASLGHRNPQDVLDSIEYHWKILSADIKHFLLEGPRSLVDFVNFWSEPHRIENAKGSCATSISGSSWFLALNYLFLDKLVEAQTLLLHGSFMHECASKPIESIVNLCNTTPHLSDDFFKQQLPCFRDAFISSQTKQLMESFLHKVLPPDYRRRMSFACQTGKDNGHSIVDDFVSFISNDWNVSSSSSAASSRPQTKGSDSNSIEVVLMNAYTSEESTVTVAMSATLKTLFNDYADKRGTSLRSLRFSHDGKILFLSSVANKTAEQVGIKHLDTIHISSTPSSTQAASVESPKKISPRKYPSKANKKSKGKGARKQSTASPAPAATDTDNYEQDKIQHSKQLSVVFDEAQPLLKSIRQRINSLNIERTLPKKRSSRKKSKATVTPIWNPSTTGVGVKAGKSHFVVQVGESCNLYKTTKRPSRSLQQQKPIVTDLHGLTKEEALSKLDSSLPQWRNIAMSGSYPFVIPVNIVCGGGNQVLSEAVENWVRQNDNVCNAPKSLYAA